MGSNQKVQINRSLSSVCVSGSRDGQEDIWHLLPPRGWSHDPLPQHGDPGPSAHLHHKGLSDDDPRCSCRIHVSHRQMNRSFSSCRTRARSTWKTLRRTCWRVWAARCPSTSAGGTCGRWWWRKEVEEQTSTSWCYFLMFWELRENRKWSTCVEQWDLKQHYATILPYM